MWQISYGILLLILDVIITVKSGSDNIVAILFFFATGLICSGLDNLNIIKHIDLKEEEKKNK